MTIEGTAGSDWLCDGAALVLAASPGSISHRRGAAFLARQAIERMVRTELGERVGDRATWKSRFLVLGVVRRDVDAARGYWLWSRWSEICHYHAYDLVPLADEVQRRIDETHAWIVAASQRDGGAV